MARARSLQRRQTTVKKFPQAAPGHYFRMFGVSLLDAARSYGYPVDMYVDWMYGRSDKRPILDWAEVVNKISQDPKYTNRTVIVPRGDYWCNSTMYFGKGVGARPIHWMGEGPVGVDDPARDKDAATLHWPRGAVFRWPTTFALGPAIVIYASETHLSDLRFQGQGPNHAELTVAMLVAAKVHFDRCVMLNWKVTDAVVFVTADVHRVDPATGITVLTRGTSNSIIQGLQIRGTWGTGDGWEVGGGDANNMTVIGLDVSDVEQGIPVNEGSFLGNSYFGTHANVGDANYKTNVNPPISTRSASSNRSRFFGCYVEGDHPVAIYPPASWIAGQARVGGGGGSLTEGVMTNFDLVCPTLRGMPWTGRDEQQIFRVEIPHGFHPTTGKPLVDFFVGQYDGRVQLETETYKDPDTDEERTRYKLDKYGHYVPKLDAAGKAIPVKKDTYGKIRFLRKAANNLEFGTRILMSAARVLLGLL